MKNGILGYIAVQWRFFLSPLIPIYYEMYQGDGTHTACSPALRPAHTVFAGSTARFRLTRTLATDMEP